MLRPARRRVSTPRALGASGAGRPARSLGILLIAFGLLFLQGPRLLHLLLVAHATCEHGELVEVHSDHDRSVSPSLDGPRAGTGEDRVAPAHAEGSDHDHCDALAVRHLPSGVGPSVIAPSLLTIAPPAALRARDEARPVPLLALAPKSSPPVS